MSKRSDFAQKLLDDLRLRKERMGASNSQGSKSSKPLPVDAYAYSKQAYKGSRKTEAHNIGSRNETTIIMPNQRGRSTHTQGALMEIVPFRRDHRSVEQVGDLSMALAFALDNGVKLGTMSSSSSSSVLRFLQQMGKKSVDCNRMERVGVNRQRSSSGHVPGVSHFHIKEVSKGAQKLNQILRAWSTDMSFDRYSVEIGKELLKGAIDLEESLQMLANLQEGSDHLITSQTKARITLLDEDEDDYETSLSKDQYKQLARPRFSFDKASARRQDAAALDYRAEGKQSKNDSSAYRTSSLVSHRRAYSLDSRLPAAVPEQNNQSSSSRQGKVRMPNIIAKLMGLDDLPKDSNPVAQKESAFKPRNKGIAVKRTADVSISEAKKESKTVENIVSFTKTQKQIQSNQGQKDQAIGSYFREAKASAVEVNDKVSLKIDHHGKTSQSDRNAARRKETKDNVKLPELHGRGKEMDRLIQRNELQLVGSQSGLQPKATSPLHREKAVLVSNNGLISSADRGTRQAPQPSNSELMHQEAKPQLRNPKNKIQFTRKKGNEEIPRKIPDFLHNQRKHSHRDKQREHLAQEIKSKQPNPKLLPIIGEKAKRTNKSTTARKVDEPMTRTNGGSSLNLSRPLKQQSSVLQEMKERMRDKAGNLRESEMQETRSGLTRIERSPDKQDMERLNSVEELQTDSVEASDSIRPPMINELQIFINQEQSQEITSTGRNELDVADHPSNEFKEPIANTTDQAEREEPENPIPKHETSEPLTEKENHLKKILVSSQAFLNTAQALFDLDVPDYGSREYTLDPKSKLMLDCGYEIMRRKGRKHELGLVRPIKATFDDLIRQMHDDIEKLESYGRTGIVAVEDECYWLPGMLECDVYDKIPDVNCMWEFGWEGAGRNLVGKDEVARELEKILLNGLLDELAMDMMVVTVF